MAFDSKDIKAVLFDIDNTLLDFNKCARWAIYRAAEEMDIFLPDNAYDVFKSINDELWSQVEQEKISVRTLHEIRFCRIFEALQIASDGHRMEELFFGNLAKSTEKEEGAVGLLASISQKYECYAASNAQYDQQVTRLKGAGLLPYFSGIFVSGDIGFSKPHPGFFDACFTELYGIKPEESIFIGDSITADIKGAYEYGMHSIWYNKNKSKEGCPMADYTFESLKDIETFLLK